MIIESYEPNKWKSNRKMKRNIRFEIRFNTNKVWLSLHCNYGKSYLLLNGKVIINLNVKQDVSAFGIIKPYRNKDEAF